MKSLVLILSLFLFSHLALGQDEEEIITEEEIVEAVPAPVNPLQKIQDLGYKELDFKALQDKEVIKILREMLKDSPLAKMPKEDLKELILSQSKGKFFHSYLERSPKVMKTIVEILQDSEAMPALLGILLKKKELEIFFYLWIGLIISTWVVKRFWLKRKKKWSKGKRFMVSLMISFASGVVSLGAFYYLFNDEVMPVTKIIVTNWRKRNL